MDDIGIRFRVTDQNRFGSLRTLFYEMKKDKDSDSFRDPEQWTSLVADEVKAIFNWPSAENRKKWLAVRARTPIAISEPADQLGSTWDFYRVFESVEEAEYSLLSCEMTEAQTAEIHIDPWGYPYGGVGPIIALAEAFGFCVLGVNEYGKYQTREELLGEEPQCPN
jgi:hypothetical protein